MGVSTLHQHFRALTSMSPLQYQKKFRLHSARERMSMDGLDPSSKPWRTSTSFTPLCGRNLRRARCTRLRSELLLRRSGREIPFPAPALRDVRRLESETREAFRFLDLASRRSLLLRTRIWSNACKKRISCGRSSSTVCSKQCELHSLNAKLHH